MLQKIKFYAILLSVLGVIAVIASCKKNKSDDPQPTAQFAYSRAKLEKRFTVTNVNRTSGAPTSTLIAIEFVGDVYILYFPNDSIATGTCITSGTDEIILNKYGTLKVNSVTDTNFGFTLTVNNSPVVFTSAVAEQAIADSDHTNKLCRTWTLAQYSVDGITYPQSNSEVTFNKYGTYLTKQTQFGISSIASNTWMWTNTAEDSICYGAWDGGNISDCDGLGTVSMDFSADGKSLTMVEDFYGIETIVYKLVVKE